MSVSAVDLEPRSRLHSGDELIADSCVHGLGLGSGLTGAIVLFVMASHQGDTLKFGAVLIYALALLTMLGASAAYNIGYATRFRALLRRCDHAAILLMIAGTYTPFTLAAHTGPMRVALTLAIWIAAGAGIYLKFTAPALFERISVALFLGLGWASVLVLGPIAHQLPVSAMAALIGGGLLYSLGLLFHMRETLRFHNAIWHVFVLGAAACHYAAVMWGVVLAAL
jgi:hemolysin III